MKPAIHTLVAGALMASLGWLTACNDDDWRGNRTDDTLGGMPFLFSGEIDQETTTRVNDSGFCDGDEMAVYIVDYNGTEPGTLADKGNRATNLYYTYDEPQNKWTPAYDVYWKDNKTNVDIYGYYPAGTPSEVNRYAFTVQKDQTTGAENGLLGGYEASDFLWAKVENLAPTSRLIRLSYQHRMSNARVVLQEGTGFASGEWAGLEKSVLAMNTRREATIDIATGVVTPAGEVEKTGIVMLRNGDEFRAVIVPQTVDAVTPLFLITVNGVTYTFKRSDALEFVAGRMMNFTITVNKKEATGEYEFVLLGESITKWENDNVSHDATAREYIVINVEEPGTLKECITAAKKDYTLLKNLKVTGRIDGRDFYFMRDEMTMLQALNLKEVKIEKYVGQYGEKYEEDVIPAIAMENKSSLLRLVLPDRLVKIEYNAFSNCTSLSGSLHIPEGVKEIGSSAFDNCKSLTGTLYLPTTLEETGNYAFSGCSFVCELTLPPNLKRIGPASFMRCYNLYGELHLPNKLSYIGDRAFIFCSSLTGSLTIPQTITELPKEVFASCSGLNGTLSLHDGITQIDEYAFSNCKFKGELILPKDLTVLSSSAFQECQFSGELKLPSNLAIIQSGAFKSCTRISGILDIPQGVTSIGAQAFSGCQSLEGIVLPKSVESILSGAFRSCYGIGSIACKSNQPPYIMSGAFDGVAKDNFTVEVPEAAINDYKTAPGWSEFKRIAAHHELVCRPSLANALNTSRTRRLVLNAEGDWEVVSKPDWCSLSAESGSQKTELQLTFDALPKGADDREGEIVFRLKGLDYTATCSVAQYDYQYGEDEFVTLQTHQKGKGIDLVFLGDGFSAKDIKEGAYMKAMQEQVQHFFNIEPYRTYRDYFNVYTGIAVSTESGIGTVNTIRYNRFETTFTGGVGLQADDSALFGYACQAPTVSEASLNRTLIIVTPNTTDYGGITHMWGDGSAIAFCPMSNDSYPYDMRGVLQHEAGGHGFGKLGDEYIYHNAFITACSCGCCAHTFSHANGWYKNLSLTGKMDAVPWSHLIFDPRYSNKVDIYEGGYMHSRGVFRSEQNSCMNNNVPYFSAISRQAIVERIMEYAGEPFSFEEFAKNDSWEVGDTGQGTTRSLLTTPEWQRSSTGHQHAPVVMPGKPVVKKQR